MSLQDEMKELMEELDLKINELFVICDYWIDGYIEYMLMRIFVLRI